MTMLDPAAVLSQLDSDDGYVLDFIWAYFHESRAANPAVPAEPLLDRLDRLPIDGTVTARFRRRVILDLLEVGQHTPGSVERVADLLAGAAGGRRQRERAALLRILRRLSPELLAPVLGRLESMAHVDWDLRRALRARVELLDAPPEQLLDLLLQSAETIDASYDGSPVRRGSEAARSREQSSLAAESVTRVAAVRHQDVLTDRAMELLQNPEVTDFREPCLIGVLGATRQERTVPLLVGKLAETDADYTCAEAMNALVEIGTDAVVEQVSVALDGRKTGDQMYHTGVLSNIKRPNALAACLRRAEASGDYFDYASLLVLAPTDSELLGRVGGMLRQAGVTPWDGANDLAPLYAGLCAMLGLDNPDVRSCRRRWPSRLDTPQYWLDDPNHAPPANEVAPHPFQRHSMKSALGLEPDDDDADTLPDEVAGAIGYVTGPIRRTSPPVGRNDPCPCGSGKKFKKCCGR